MKTRYAFLFMPIKMLGLLYYYFFFLQYLLLGCLPFHGEELPRARVSFRSHAPARAGSAGLAALIAAHTCTS